MGKIFDLDSPFMNVLNKLADLIWLNILTLICCIPIITIGASMTALNYVVLKLVRNEEGYITKAFFKSFKENFRQATIIWLILLLVFALFGLDFMAFRYSGISFPQWMRVALLAVGIVVLFAIVYLFPVLSRFENTIVHTFKNSLFMGILTFPKTVLMMVCWVIPIIIAVFIPRILPVNFALGISGPVFLNALLYNGTFKRFEPQEEEKEPDEWTIEAEESDADAQEMTDAPEAVEVDGSGQQVQEEKPEAAE
ncbi:MAG: DUF624 domain-containing protein [Lachnospiraceae bacterium]|nr:DUF624 domain-containing protein [Lachnospiraceae bacterium]